VAPHLCSGIDAGDRCRRDRRASRLDLRRVRFAGHAVLEDAGTIDRFEKCSAGVRLIYSKSGAREHRDSTLVVVAIGWVANTDGLNLDAAGVQSDSRGFVQVDSCLRTSAPHVFAAGDVTGHLMVVHEAVRAAYVAATNAALVRR
jgi:pyruvate/2-oxoglutarate dehydrogenase complex dihydrolipoamide dehydrogenase (E3) component